MSIDVLQEKIRKGKNPSMVAFDLPAGRFPPHLLEGVTAAAAYRKLCVELLEGLRGLVPAVRFGFASFGLLGPEGLGVLADTPQLAKSLGYYVVLDAPELLSPQSAELAAQALLGGSLFPCNGVVISPYLGSEGIKPFLPYCEKGERELFVAARTGNKSAPEIQDLLTGTRVVHSAVADRIQISGERMIGKFGYSQVAAVAGAGASESTRSLRSKYKQMFLLLDGYDYPGANAKRCSYGFDKLGRGAVVCAGSGITCAWQEAGSDGTDYVDQAVRAAERMKRNLTGYLTIL